MASSVTSEKAEFQAINTGYNAVFRVGRLTVGLVVPIERYERSPVPTMEGHLDRAKLAEELGFSSLWLRDVPFNVPSFGDAGQMFDPFVYLGHLSAGTERIALGVASIILPLRHPAHVAKAAASADVLSGGRLILGVASGDRPDEYPALNLPYEDRSERFRESFHYLRKMGEEMPIFSNSYGQTAKGMDMLPKPVGGKVPMLITGGSQQTTGWIAENGDGWMLYPREAKTQAEIVRIWRECVEGAGRVPQPVMQSLYIDLVDGSDDKPQPIHLGFRSGVCHLLDHLKALEEAGINHVALNLRFNQNDVPKTLHRIADEILPNFRN